MISFILSIVIRMILAASAPGDAHFIRTEVADGSVWADVWESHDGRASLRRTVRLCDADPQVRFVSVDVDGDGRLDVVAFGLDGEGLQVWRATEESFVRLQ